LLFTFYLVIATILIIRIPFIKKTGLSSKTIAGLFLLKIFAALSIGWLTHQYYPVNDYWLLNENGLVEYDLLMHHPHEFLTNIFRSPYQNGYDGFFNAVGSYWNDLRYNIILKLLAVCNVFSRGNYYINSIFFNFFGFFGSVALCHVFADVYKNKKWAVLAGCFLLPSTLYFCSGIGKDLIVFTMLGLFCYTLYFSVKRAFNTRRSLVIIISMVIILLMRNFVAVSLIPVSIAFIISIKKRINPLATFVATYAVIFLSVLLSQVIKPSSQPLKIITQRQRDFLNIPGEARSQLNVYVLEPSLKSFAINLPHAVDHGFSRPRLGDAGGKFMLPFAIELLLYELIFLFVVFMHRSAINFNHPFILFAFFFSVFMFLVTGYIIPNTGSIIRYKSIYLPFIITPLLCSFPKIYSSDRHIKL
jgi:hypothetical protein